MNATWIIASIIIIAGIGIKIVKNQKINSVKKPKKEIKTKKEEVNHDKKEDFHEKHDDHGHNGHESKSNMWSNILPLFVIIFLSFLTVFGFIFGIRYIKKTKPKSETEYYWKIEKTVTIYFTGEYSEIYRGVEPGTKVSFRNATEPYCVKNIITEYCAQKGEDVGKQMPDSTNNNELQFKSQNSKNGSIEIVFYVWTIKK